MTKVRFAIPVVVLAVLVMPAGVISAGAAQAAGKPGPAVNPAGRAIEVPSHGAPNTSGGYAGYSAVTSISCGLAGDCVAGGYYQQPTGVQQGFVASDQRRAWRRALEVPGLGALNAGGYAQVLSVSCPPVAGDCGAGGYYNDRSGYAAGFVASERNGVWGRASEVPGLAALTRRGYAAVRSVACPSAGGCAAAGTYGSSSNERGFVASQRRGVWGRAMDVPGLRALNTGRFATINSLACASAGNCAAGGSYTACVTGGFYTNAIGYLEGFVASERGGVWGRAFEIPGLGGLNAGGHARVSSVSCASAGNCAVGGSYQNRYGRGLGFLSDERHGTWGRAFEVAGLGALETRQRANVGAEVVSVSCPSAGNCTAGGYFEDNADSLHGFVVSERGEAWGRAFQLPGLSAL